MFNRSVVALVMASLLTVAWQTAEGQQLTACSGNCATIAVQGGTLASNMLDVPITFTQAPNDNQQGSGNDDTAAIAFTLGLGDENTPLALNDCTLNADGLPNSVTPGAAIADQFRVVVENASCANRNRCLCPDTGQGQTKDNFINIVVYGPKDLPASGPVNIPRLPSGQLLSIKLKSDTASQTQRMETLRIFAETDLTNPKPQFGAYLSIGDQAAVDQTANRGTSTSKITVSGTADVVIPPGGTGCVGDCDNSTAVSVSELITGVNIALGRAQLSVCPSFDQSGNGKVEVNELVTGVNNALHGCP